MKIDNYIKHWRNLILKESLDEAMSIDDILKICAQRSAEQKKKDDEKKARDEEYKKKRRIKTIIINDMDTDKLYYTIKYADGRSEEQEMECIWDDEYTSKIEYRLKKQLGRQPKDEEIAISMLKSSFSSSKYPIDWKISNSLMGDQGGTGYYDDNEDYRGWSQDEIEAEIENGVKIPGMR